MRFGLSLIPHIRVDHLADLAAEAEALGFSDIWIPDHYFSRDSFVFLAQAATRTTRVRLGTAVASPFLRHPALLASTVATIDELSGGRAILGIGPGGFEFESQLGISIEKPRTATREAIDIARHLWTGEVVSTDGAVFGISHARIPYIDSRQIPVYMAARGPLMLETGGAIADGVITHGLSDAHLDFAIAQVEKGAEEQGRSRPAMVMMVDCVVDELPQAHDRLRSACVVMAGGNYDRRLIEKYGLDQDAVARLREAVQAGDFAEAATRVTDEMVDAFCLAGPPDRCRNTLERLERAGIDEIIIMTNAFTDAESMRKGIREVVAALGIGGGHEPR